MLKFEFVICSDDSVLWDQPFLDDEVSSRAFRPLAGGGGKGRGHEQKSSVDCFV